MARAVSAVGLTWSSVHSVPAEERNMWGSLRSGRESPEVDCSVRVLAGSRDVGPLAESAGWLRASWETC